MSAESAAGERFARDMRRIREDRNVSQDDIHRETRIAITLITAFEQDGLFKHPAFNRVYLRSFVRAYAGCIDIDPELALNHLERALVGEYENELAVRILDTTPSMGGYDPEEAESSSEPTDDAPGTSPTVDRPLSRQEQEPPRFSPRPVGNGPRNASDEKKAKEEPADEDIPEDETAEQREQEDTSAGDAERAEADDAGAKEQEVAESGHVTSDEDTSDEETREEDEPEAAKAEPKDDQPGGAFEEGDASEEKDTSAESLEEGTSAKPSSADGSEPDAGATDGPDVDDLETGDSAASDSTTDARDTAGNAGENAAAEESVRSRAPKRDRSGTAGGTVFNKRPVGSGEEGTDRSGVDEAEDTASERGAPESSTSGSAGSESDRVEEDDSEKDGAEETKVSEPSDLSGDADDVDDKAEADEADTSDEPSPAQRFRQATEGDKDGPPPPPQGKMVGKPRPVGSATDTTRTARDSSRAPMESPMAARSEKQRADRDLRVSEALEENRTLLISVAVVVGVFVVGLAIWFAFFGDADTQDGPSTADAQQAQVSDQPADPDAEASAEADTMSASQPPLADLALGDTLQLVVEAQSNVIGIRIERDRDVRRPYWINEGETMAFPFTEQIVVWDNIENIDLYLERYRYPETQHLDAQGRVVITRDSAQVFAETVRGSAASFPTPTVRPLDESFPEPEETPIDSDTLQQDEEAQSTEPGGTGGALSVDMSSASDTTASGGSR